MKYKIIFILLLSSCVNYSYNGQNKSNYYSKGFAYIEHISSTNVIDDIFHVSHNQLKVGSKVRITNPDNNKSIEAIIKNKVKYDNFYKVMITKYIAKELNLDLDFPYVEVNEIKLNKSFIAKKAITENVEKKIANKAPVDKISIDNISIAEKIDSPKSKTYSILVARFYNLSSAEFLREKLTVILDDSNYQLINITKKNDKSYELLMGPYNTINKLKNDYTILNNSNFEDLDIKIND
jgi:hypothetical protein